MIKTISKQKALKILKTSKYLKGIPKSLMNHFKKAEYVFIGNEGDSEKPTENRLYLKISNERMNWPTWKNLRYCDTLIKMKYREILLVPKAK